MQFKMKNKDLLTAQAEINNIVTKATEVPVKFYLTDLFERISNSLKPYIKLIEELLQEKGVTMEGTDFRFIREYPEGIDTEKATPEDRTPEYKQLLELQAQETHISFQAIPISAFKGISSEYSYPILTKFIDFTS